MRGGRRRIRQVSFAEQIPRHPLGVFPKNLVIDVLEQVVLDRLARPVARLNPVHHHPAGAPDEVPVKERDGRSEPRVQLALPLLPLFPFQVPPRDPLAAIIEDMQVVAVLEIRREEPLERRFGLDVDRRHPPPEHPPRVVRVALRIPAGRHVEHHAAAPFVFAARLRELNSQLRLANAGRAHDHGQRAGEQSAAQQRVQPGNSGGKPLPASVRRAAIFATHHAACFAIHWQSHSLNRPVSGSCWVPTHTPSHTCHLPISRTS